MTPETAAQTLRQQAEYWSQVDGPHPMREGAVEIAKALQMGADALDAQGWRPIAEHDGDTQHAVIGWGPGLDDPIEAAWYPINREWATRSGAVVKLTHYMPLPTPPEEL